MLVNDEERKAHMANAYRILNDDGIFIVDHCQDNWGSGVYSLPGELYDKKKLVVGNIIDRRIRTADGEKLVRLEIIPFAERKTELPVQEICSVGFKVVHVYATGTQAFGSSALLVFKK